MWSKVTVAWAQDHGYTVDRSCYPWFAYKGPRFNPSEARLCWTDTESNLRLLLGGAVVYAIFEMVVVVSLLFGGVL